MAKKIWWIVFAVFLVAVIIVNTLGISIPFFRYFELVTAFIGGGLILGGMIK